jgi:uncharacterized protein YdcH (DUF465 family)
MSEPIDLDHAFPHYVKQMHALRKSDAHFGKLYDDYLHIEKELHRIANEAETPEDTFVEELKKKRLALKDEMSAILHKAA